MKPNLSTKLLQLSQRLEELNHLLSAVITRDLDHYRKLTREHAELRPVVEFFHAYQPPNRTSPPQEMLSDPR